MKVVLREKCIQGTTLLNLLVERHLKPGEYIITDLQGPYVRTMYGEKYSQIFIDVASKRVWVERLKKKKDSDNEKVLLDSRARSGNKIRILRTDGDDQKDSRI